LSSFQITFDKNWGKEYYAPQSHGERKMRPYGSQWDTEAMRYLYDLGPDASFKSILDRSCGGKYLVLGVGSEINWVNNVSRDVVGINISHDELLGIAGSKDSLILVDAERPPFKGSSFDVVISKATLHHLVKLNIAMAGIKGVLRSGGYLVLYEPGIFNPIAFFCRKLFPTNIHVASERPFIPTALKKMLISSQFRIIKEEYHFLFVHIVPIFARWLPFLRNRRLLRMLHHFDALLCRSPLRNLCWILIFYCSKE